VNPRSSHYRWVGLLAFLAPVAIVKAGGSLLSGIGPAVVEATSIEMEELPLDRIVAPATPSDASRLAAARAAEVRTVPIGSSPFALPRRPQPTERPTEAATPFLPLPDVTLQAVMRGATPLAMIDGRAYRAGDRLDAVWSIASIDAALRQVTLRSADGSQDHVLTVPID